MQLLAARGSVPPEIQSGRTVRHCDVIFAIVIFGARRRCTGAESFWQWICCDFVVEPKGWVDDRELARRSEQSENEAVQ